MTILNDLSSALAERAKAAAPSVAAIKSNERRHLTGTLWQGDLLVASSQSLRDRESYDIVLPGGSATTAKLLGRDPGTNIALLKLATATATPPAQPWSEPQWGAVALALGADGQGGASLRLGIVSALGPEWHSRAGGRIDKRIVLDAGLGRAEEGGPVIDASGARLGITTFGPRRQVIVIPAPTIDRVVPLLEKEGHVARGWLGAMLQPVAVPEPLRETAGHKTGLMVMQIAANGPAANAGIFAGDILLTIDGEAAWPFRPMMSRLGPDSIGRQIQLRYIRGGEVKSCEATITPRPKAA